MKNTKKTKEIQKEIENNPNDDIKIYTDLSFIKTYLKNKDRPKYLEGYSSWKKQWSGNKEIVIQNVKKWFEILITSQLKLKN